MEITWVKGSTSWFWFKVEGKNVHIDPSYTPKGQSPGVEMDEKADLILITHSHGDHFQRKTVDGLRTDATVVMAPAKVAGKLAPISPTIAVPGQELDLGWAKVKAVHAYNLGLKGHFMHVKGKCVGYLLTVGGRTIYHAGDTGLIPEMKQLGHVDLALLPIGGTFTMDVDEAAEAARTIGASTAVPMHNLRTPCSELQVRLDGDPRVSVHLAEPGKSFSY
jgi:L-ascorbate metabolism protein UlaG (beta-lactamase superfamily)